MSLPCHPHVVYRQKSNLVDLGLYFLAHGDLLAVQAITRLIARRGWTHE